MSPARLILLGCLVALAAVGLVALGRAMKGPENPACAFLSFSDECRHRVPGDLVQASALPVAIVGGVVAAVGIARRFHADEEPPHRS